MSNDDLSQHDNVVSSNEVAVVEKKQRHTESKTSVRPKIKRREVVNGKPKRGRPTKAAIAKKKNPGTLGRPPGDAARIAEFKARLLATAGDTVITKIIETALADGHPAQGAMLKFCGERLLPLSSFEAKSGGGTPQISINITGINSPTVEAAEVIENDYTDVVIKDIE